MQTFKINRDSWHYKLNKNFFNEYSDHEYYMRNNWEQRHNNFCSYWRVTMLRLIFLAFITIFIVAIFSTLAIGIYQNPWTAVIVFSSIIGICVTFIGLAAVSAYLDTRKRKRKNEEAPDSLFIAKYKSYKSKVCPMVEYEK